MLEIKSSSKVETYDYRVCHISDCISLATLMYVSVDKNLPVCTDHFDILEAGKLLS